MLHPVPCGRGVALLLLVLSSPARGGPDAAAPSLLSVEEAVDLAVDGAPAVRAAEARLLEAQGLRARSALFLQNPSVGAGVSVDGERVEVEALQPVSVTGEGRFAHRAARFEIESAEAALRRARLETAAEVRVAYAAAAAWSRVVELSAEGAELARRLREAVVRQHELGEASLLGVRLARMSEVDVAAEVLDARGEEAEALRALAALVRRPLNGVELATDPLVVAPVPDLREGARRADVIAAQARVEAAQAALSRQRAAVVPPVGIGAFLEKEGEETAFGPAVSVSLPVFDRNQVGRAAALGELARAEAAAEAVVARAQTEQATARERLDEAGALTEALGADLEDEARAALASIEAGYRAGEIDLPTAVLLQAEVLDGLRATIRLRQRLAEARVDLLLALEDPALLPGGVE